MPALIVARYFKSEQIELGELQTNMENASQEVGSFVEEQSDEDLNKSGYW